MVPLLFQKPGTENKKREYQIKSVRKEKQDMFSLLLISLN